MKSICWLLLFFVLHSITVAAQRNRPQLPVRRHAFIVIAHRGSHLQFPENSLAAIKDAISAGADYTELDLRTTADSELVIIHDKTLDRTTNGKGRVNELSYDEIRKLELRGVPGYISNTGKIPSFEEVLRLCRHRIHIYLDFKDADAGKTYHLIKQYGMEKEVIVYINSIEQYKSWRTVAPAMPLILSLPDDIKDETGLKDFLDQTALSVLDGDFDKYTNKMVTVAASYGVMVWPDIQGNLEAQHWDAALNLGFSGLQTDHPRALISYMKGKHLR
jgi:glycerophosphoryl diester phosphodiesterase